nr:uncharacterized protein LOC111513713 [Leptinotarsa decemlineata]
MENNLNIIIQTHEKTIVVLKNEISNQAKSLSKLESAKKEANESGIQTIADDSIKKVNISQKETQTEMGFQNIDESTLGTDKCTSTLETVKDTNAKPANNNKSTAKNKKKQNSNSSLMKVQLDTKCPKAKTHLPEKCIQSSKTGNNIDKSTQNKAIKKMQRKVRATDRLHNQPQKRPTVRDNEPKQLKTIVNGFWVEKVEGNHDLNYQEKENEQTRVAKQKQDRSLRDELEEATKNQGTFMFIDNASSANGTTESWKGDSNNPEVNTTKKTKSTIEKLN